MLNHCSLNLMLRLFQSIPKYLNRNLPVPYKRSRFGVTPNFQPQHHRDRPLLQVSSDKIQTTSPCLPVDSSQQATAFTEFLVETPIFLHHPITANCQIPNRARTHAKKAAKYPRRTLMSHRRPYVGFLHTESADMGLPAKIPTIFSHMV
jgi:hypothetical protein